MIIKRTLAKTIDRASQIFPIILLTGPRQVGKTTLLETCASDSNKTYVTLDNLTERKLAKTDPALFLQLHKTPIIIDEVQYAPELFSDIKISVDEGKQKGMFWLTGSQQFHLMRNITETLAGRVAIINMQGLSQAELEGRADKSIPFLPTTQWVKTMREISGTPKKQLMDVYTAIWYGAFPAMWTLETQSDDAAGDAVATRNVGDDVVEHSHGQRTASMLSHADRDLFYDSYIQTYIQRDVRDLAQVGDELLFHHFLKAIAARTGQLLNYSDIARDVGINQKTVKSWLSILQTSGLIYLLYPYHNNVTKRIIKTPKLYFLDTGLCAYLTNWSTPEALESGAISGAILETYIFSEILKSYWHNGKQVRFYFYRDNDQREVDLLIEQDNMIYPVEFKKTATPSQSVTKNFAVLEKLGKKIASGAVICFSRTDTLLSEKVAVIPVGYL